MDKADRALGRMYTANPVRFVRPSIPAVKPEKQAASCQACVVSESWYVQYHGHGV